MKTEEEIRKKLKRIQLNKNNAKKIYSEEAYIINCKLEKLFKWVLEK